MNGAEVEITLPLPPGVSKRALRVKASASKQVAWTDGASPLRMGSSSAGRPSCSDALFSFFETLIPRNISTSHEAWTRLN